MQRGEPLLQQPHAYACACTCVMHAADWEERGQSGSDAETGLWRDALWWEARESKVRQRGNGARRWEVDGVGA